MRTVISNLLIVSLIGALELDHWLFMMEEKDVETDSHCRHHSQLYKVLREIFHGAVRSFIGRDILTWTADRLRRRYYLSATI